jgi:hypothetical protein
MSTASPEQILEFAKKGSRPLTLDKNIIAYFGDLLPSKKREVDGAAVLSIMWYDVAKKVVENAIKVYKLKEDQAQALRTVYTQFKDYTVEEEN